MEEEVPKVNVRQLISVYESGAPQRPRARSLGNVLGNDVIVRSHNYHTLSDIEDALEVVQENLNDYQTYNKSKHVKFQETLFTLLTSVINIEADPDDDPARKKSLISQTQKLVSVLNRKLPSSGSSEESIKTDQETGTRKQVVETNYTISVHKLRQNFQSSTTKNSYKSLSTIQNDVADSTNNLSIQEAPKTSEEQVTVSLLQSPDVETSAVPEEPAKPEVPISVRKLRDIFEQKEKENNTGLELIIKPKTFQYEVSIPYTAETLGRYRMFRANSGNYMNEVGVLNRVSISRAKSIQEVNSYSSYIPYNEEQEEEEKSIEDTLTSSDVSSEISEADSLESVKEAKMENSEQWRGNGMISVRNAINVFETFQEIHIQGGKSTSTFKQTITNIDPEGNNLSDDEVFTQENGLLGGNKTEVEITEIIPERDISHKTEVDITEITPEDDTSLKNQSPIESDNELESFTDANNLMY